MPACNLYSLLKKSSTACNSFTPAGVGDRVYLFDADEMWRGRDFPQPDDDGFIAASEIDVTKCYALDIKTDSGQVTSEKGEDNQGRSLVFTAIVDHNIEKWLGIDAAIGNGMNVGAIVPIDNTRSYIVYSPYRRAKYSSNYDSGTTYDSDHGFTITITCSPVLFGCPMVRIGRNELKTADDLNEWTSYVTTGTVKTFTLNDRYQQVTKSGTYQLTPKSSETADSYTWSSSDTTVATVSNSGLVTGVSAGSAYIIAKSAKTGLSAVCEILVIE